MMEAEIRTYEDAKRAGMPVFKIISDGVGKAYTAKDGTRWFEVTASSNSTDLTGDYFTEKALKQMEEAAPGTTMFLNHSYTVPEDVFGIVTEAKLETATVNGREILRLVYKGTVNTDNERAVQVHKMMESKASKLGASISVLILDAKELRDGRRAIDEIYYLECSIVGIPCNRDSWAKAASKALPSPQLVRLKSLEEERDRWIACSLNQQALIAVAANDPSSKNALMALRRGPARRRTPYPTSTEKMEKEIREVEQECESWKALSVCQMVKRPLN